MRGKTGRGRIPGSLAAIVSMGVVFALPMSCARQPRINVDQLVCTTSENCPVGRQCIQGSCVVSESASRDAATDAPGIVGPDGAAVGAGGAGSVDLSVPMWDSHLTDMVADSGSDVPVLGAGGAAGNGGAGGGGGLDVSGVSGGGGMLGAGGIRGTGGSGPIDAAGGANGSGGSILVGGSLGSGGLASIGGARSSGGVVGSGGITGSGGIVSSGGITGSGGIIGTGGVIGSGGIIGSGGVIGSGGTPSTGGVIGSGGAITRPTGPCDIYAAASTPCAAAYSMVRALSSAYSGPLYQVRSGSSSTNMGTGGALMDIGVTADGYADTATQDNFCNGTTCTVSTLYDQSGNNNDLQRGSAGPSGNGTRSGYDDYESTATKLAITAGGHRVYALYMAQYEGYRTPLNVIAKGVPMGNKDQGIYELADGTHFGGACCWDFGSVSPDPGKYVTMNTLFFGKGFWGSGTGTTGPWFGGDFEAGVWMGGSSSTPGNNPSNPSMAGVAFALGILHTPVGKYSLRMADISAASDLTTAYDGAIPSGKTWGNAGGIVLGVGGDNSSNSSGTFYEGAVTVGSPSNATDLLIMQNIQAVQYTK